MPIYEYLCKPCAEVYEELVDAHLGKPSIVCPNCGKLAMRKPSNFNNRMFTEKLADQLGMQLKRRPNSYKDLKDLMGDGELVSKQEWRSKIKQEWDMDRGNTKQVAEEAIVAAKEQMQNIEIVRATNKAIIEGKNMEYLNGAAMVPQKG